MAWASPAGTTRARSRPCAPAAATIRSPPPIIQACYELDLPPHRLAKLSGIGCSSKTPDYFVGASHGFNSVHGRMPSVLTGANLANRDLIYLGVSGDGDSASIGLGQFAHSIRRGVNMTYIVENNGVYGLTKGQFSATSDPGSKSKKGVVNNDQPIDLVGLALQLGATFVARSFSGDKAQLVPLIKAALTHKGAAFIDVISPCVQFNNHVGSTKSFDYVREHNAAVNRMDVILSAEEITVDYAPGTVELVTQHDGSVLKLSKLPTDYDPTDRIAASIRVQTHHAKGEILTGLIYVDPAAEELHDHLGTVHTPLNALADEQLIPGAAAFGSAEQVATMNAPRGSTDVLHSRARGCGRAQCRWPMTDHEVTVNTDAIPGLEPAPTRHKRLLAWVARDRGAHQARSGALVRRLRRRVADADR